MRDRILGQKWGLDANFRAYPFTLPMGRVRGVIARTSTAELGTKRGVLDLIKLAQFAPDFVTKGPTNVNF
jgi:hypothetical protein